MATAKWATPSAVSSDIAGTTLNSLANGSTSAFVTYDNSTNLDLYASVRVTLASIATPASGAYSITLRVFSTQNGNAPDATGSVGGGETYSAPVTLGTSAKVIVFPMIRLYPESMRLCITNNTGATLASTTAGSIYVRPYNESAV